MADPVTIPEHPRDLIGTVEILAPREYALNPEDDVTYAPVTVMVPPGAYPVWERDERIYWEMDGEVIHQCYDSTFERVPDMQGTFIMRPPYTYRTGHTVTFPSRSFTKDDFNDFVANDLLCQPGTLTQRLKFVLYG